MDDDPIISNELEKKIADAFSIFDHGGNNMVDLREIGTILRGLGCVPTENEIQDLIAEIEDHEVVGSCHLRKFLPAVVKLVQEYRLQAAPPERLLEAFKIIDKEGKGYLTRDAFTKMMMEEGEYPFTQEEVDEMMHIAVDTITGRIPYEYYINQIMAIDNNIYNVIITEEDMQDMRLKYNPQTKRKSTQDLYRESRMSSINF